ncbi:unnamed protein product [Strongylus vulgaris]|uniref:protein disulfide-isomerase n=1 Tax=Strongylus vulgaris TaxID=40348 RepID=A0A3P7IPG9_STRVU|nr:unnamed protein product [Strongylus vulgaris]
MFPLVLLFVPACLALYTSKDDVVELTSTNFQNRVINSDEIWIVEFYAPWCGHCKNLAPEYKKAATALKGIIKVGAVDMTQHQSVGAPYNVQGFPTIKIFGADKKKPTDYNAQSIADATLAEAKRVVSGRLGGKSSGSSGSGDHGGGSGGATDVIELTDANFEKLVLHSKDVWLVEFFAPWCGHCKNLAPHWKAAASELKGKVKLGALDATVHTVMANKFGIRGFPTIKYFAPGSDASDAVDYDGGRTTSDIVSWASAKALENLPAPEVVQATSQQIVEDQCKERQLCIFAFLPDILDCQSKCRNDYLAVLRELGDKFKKNGWGYDGSFGKDGINEFLRDLSYGKGQTAPVKGATFPKIKKIDPWDGKDGQLPPEEDIDLSDVDLDHTEL